MAKLNFNCTCCLPIPNRKLKWKLKMNLIEKLADRIAF